MSTQPTQVKRPWRATARTVFQALVAFAAMWAVIVETIGLDPSWQWVAASLAVTGAVTRLMALPQVEAFLKRFAPFLAADPEPVASSGGSSTSVSYTTSTDFPKPETSGPVRIQVVGQGGGGGRFVDQSLPSDEGDSPDGPHSSDRH